MNGFVIPNIRPVHYREDVNRDLRKVSAMRTCLLCQIHRTFFYEILTVVSSVPKKIVPYVGCKIKKRKVTSYLLHCFHFELVK